MSPFTWYAVGWALACLVALIMVLVRPAPHAIARRAYWTALFTPWKLCFFGIALVGITLMAPYTGDPTWDHVNAPLMAILTYLTASWSVGTLYRFARQTAPLSAAFPAVCAWLISASWCYDAYLWVRDGDYPVTWQANLAASSILYAFAGLFWSLEWTPERGVHFGFMHPDWPNGSAPGAFRKLAPIAFIVMLPVLALFLAFLV